MDLDLITLLTFAGTTGLLTTLLNQGVGWCREAWSASRRRKSLAGYHALRLAVILESYAYACSEFLTDNANAEHAPGNEFPDWSTQLPTLEPYPDDSEGWRAINLQLAARLLDLRNKAAGSQSIIRATATYAIDDLGDVLDREAGSRGLEAWKLAQALREGHRLRGR